MKKVFSFILAASMMLIGAAAIAQPSLGIGYLNSTDKVKSGSTTKTTNLSGFYVGGSYNINLAGSFGVAPGLYYGLATKSDADSYFGINTNVDVTEHYLSIPVMFNAGLTFADGIVGRIYAGPSLAYGIASDKGRDPSPVFKGHQDQQHGDDYHYGRFDVMLGGGVAVEFFDMVRFNVGYDYVSELLHR
ncbi:MAG: porin family protein [Anaerovoracaceae bacterium]